jgi:hypothetical protein
MALLPSAMAQSLRRTAAKVRVVLRNCAPPPEGYPQRNRFASVGKGLGAVTRGGPATEFRPNRCV